VIITYGHHDAGYSHRWRWLIRRRLEAGPALEQVLLLVLCLSSAALKRNGDTPGPAANPGKYPDSRDTPVIPNNFWQEKSGSDFSVTACFYWRARQDSNL